MMLDEDIEIERRIVVLVEGPLFRPADQDYIASRLLYQSAHRGFLWVKLQTFEKYCKCALLLRKEKARVEPQHIQAFLQAT